MSAEIATPSDPEITEPLLGSQAIDALEEVKDEISPELVGKLSTSVVSLTMYPQLRK